MDSSFCLSCGKKSTCRAICPELERHLKRDIEVPQRELTLGLIFDAGAPMPDILRKLKLTKEQADVVALLLQGLETEDVRRQLKLSKKAFYRRMDRIKKIAKGMEDANNSSDEENQGEIGPDTSQKGGSKDE